MSEDSRPTCQELLEFLGDYLEGELPTEQLDVLQWHLDKCPPCVEYLESYRSTILMARKCIPRPDAALASMASEEDCEPCPEELIQAILAAQQVEEAPKGPDASA